MRASYGDTKNTLSVTESTSSVRPSRRSTDDVIGSKVSSGWKSRSGSKSVVIGDCGSLSDSRLLVVCVMRIGMTLRGGMMLLLLLGGGRSSWMLGGCGWESSDHATRQRRADFNVRGLSRVPVLSVCPAAFISAQHVRHPTIHDFHSKGRRELKLFWTEMKCEWWGRIWRNIHYSKPLWLSLCKCEFHNWLIDCFTE